MKICPFCKNEIATRTEVCPHCHRTLIEKDFRRSEPGERAAKDFQPSSQPEQKKFSVRDKIGKFWKKLFSRRHKTHRFESGGSKLLKNIAIGFAVVVLAVMVISIVPGSPSNGSRSGASTVPAIQSMQPSPTPTPTPPPVSLSNGKVLSKKVGYFTGSGELSIQNGTSYDAVAKLVSVASSKSVYTVYIRANNSYKIENISDGSYRLLFDLGSGWDSTQMGFSTDSDYEAFDESFDFTTTTQDDGSYENTQYTTFEVTLNPVIGGQAKTNPVSEEEFRNY